MAWFTVSALVAWIDSSFSARTFGCLPSFFAPATLTPARSWVSFNDNSLVSPMLIRMTLPPILR